MAKRYENMDNISTKKLFAHFYVGVKNENKARKISLI